MATPKYLSTENASFIYAKKQSQHSSEICIQAPRLDPISHVSALICGITAYVPRFLETGPLLQYSPVQCHRGASRLAA